MAFTVATKRLVKFNMMKKSLFGFILICLIVISCKKEHSKNTSPVQTPHKVAFTVGFSQQIIDFNTGGPKINSVKENATSTTLADKIDILYYAVYDAGGNNVHTIKQLSTDSGFGAYTDILNSGTYTVIVAGGKKGFALGPDLLVKTATSKLSTDIISYQTPTSLGTPVYAVFNKDAFYKKILITVATTDQNQSFALDRVVSQLVLIIKDAIPSSVKTVGLSASNQPYKFLVGSGTVVPPTTSSGSTMHFIDTVATSDIGKTNYQVNTMFLSYQPFTLTIGASSSIIFNGEIIAQKSVTVTGAPNTQTILSGNLFGGSGGGSGLTVKIDTAWNSTPIIKTFP